MKDWNTPDHHITDTDHGTLHFTDGTRLVIADWQVTENAPDTDGRVYASIRGWLTNGGGTGRPGDPYTQPIDAGRARLVHSELRGRQPLSERNVHIDYYTPGQPYPNTWDHPGYLVTVSWMDRRLPRRLPVDRRRHLAADRQRRPRRTRQGTPDRGGSRPVTADAYPLILREHPGCPEPEGHWPVRHNPHTHAELRRLLKTGRGQPRQRRNGRLVDLCPDHS